MTNSLRDLGHSQLLQWVNSRSNIVYHRLLYLGSCRPQSAPFDQFQAYPSRATPTFGYYELLWGDYQAMVTVNRQTRESQMEAKRLAIEPVVQSVHFIPTGLGALRFSA